LQRRSEDDVIAACQWNGDYIRPVRLATRGRWIKTGPQRGADLAGRGLRTGDRKGPFSGI